MAIPAVLWNEELIEGLKREAKFVENYADSIVVGKGKPRSSSAGATAVHQAYELLKKYGSEPTYYRHGRWHNLPRFYLGEKAPRRTVSPFVAPSSKLTVVVFGSRRDLTAVLFF